jgi:hypothetical protein
VCLSWYHDPRLKIRGVTSQFATQISEIAIQNPHLICNLLHKITPKLIRYVKNCYNTKLFFSIVLCEKYLRKSLHIEKSYFEPCLAVSGIIFYTNPVSRVIFLRLYFTMHGVIFDTCLFLGLI